MNVDRELGALSANMEHVLDELATMRRAQVEANQAVAARLDKMEERLNALFASKSVAVGALAVASSVGAFVMWLFKSFIGGVG